jgi:shikimate kinase
MPLVLITGTSTSGKSSIAKELDKRGYEAYDTEHDGISAWYNKKTGKKAAEFGEMPERSPEWLSDHEWLMSLDWVSKMTRKAKSKTIFLCGGAANEAEVRNMCQTVIWLKTNEATIRKRVSAARDHDYGTKPHELAQAIKDNDYGNVAYPAMGATIIEATQSLDKIVDDILEITQIDNHNIP